MAMSRATESRNVLEEKFKTIFEAICIGTTVTTFAKYYNMPKSTLSNIVRCLESRAEGWVPRKRRRREKLNLDSQRQMKAFIIANVFIPLQKMAVILNARGTISRSIIRSRRYLKIIGFKIESQFESHSFIAPI